MRDIATISMEKSFLSWVDVDKKIKILNMDRSEYVQRLIEGDFRKRKRFRFSIFEMVSLLCLALIIVILVMVR